MWKRLFLFILILFTAGCPPRPMVKRSWYLQSIGIRVNEVNLSYMKEECWGDTLDDGTKARWNTIYRGCYLGPDSDGVAVILVLEGERRGCVLLHELCHHEKLPRIVCKENFNLCND